MCGCSQFATVRCWQPAAIDVEGIQRLAVLDFRGENGADAAAALQSRLSVHQGYTVVDQSELMVVQHAACTTCPTESALLVQARERGLDGVIVGEVVAYRCDDDLRDPATSSSATDRDKHSDAARPGLMQRGELRREATVAINFRLLDARTGEVRAEKETLHTFRCATGAESSQLPSRSLVLGELTNLCVNDFLELLAPYQEDCEMKLARAGWYGRTATSVRTGNRMAMQGNWDAARDHWQSAIDRDSHCDAALYNLALDAAHRQQYARAEDFAMQAIRLRHTDNYAEGLERIRQHRSGFDAVAEHRDRRVLQASATFP